MKELKTVPSNNDSSCCSDGCCGNSPDWQRRDFLKSTLLTAMALYTNRFKSIAGPFAPNEIENCIPFEKRMDPDWIRSLYERGKVTSYSKSKNELQYIGMPVGGITAGTLYLAGDGRLWLWDVFNENQTGIDPKEVEWPTPLHVGKKVRSSDGSAYVAPPLAKDHRVVEQGFAFLIKYDGKSIIRKMEADDWEDIIFEATYPMATVHYIDEKLPVTISAEIFSPFIPLDEKNSGLPATIYSFKIKNKTRKPVEVSIVGWLENKTGWRTGDKESERRNSLITGKGFQGVMQGIHKLAAKNEKAGDVGSMAIAVKGDKGLRNTNFSFPITEDSFATAYSEESKKGLDDILMGAVSKKLTIPAAASSTAHFVISWHFPHLALNPVIPDKGRFYNSFLGNAQEVVGYIFSHFNYLVSNSKKWKETWYDSTLPWWFLERTFLNISTLATTTSHRFESGRFYAWEGVGCCEGTCMHVWQYAQAVARIFPNIEKDTRQRVDLGLSLQPDGMMWYRGEVVKTAAIDGQAGTILRFYREHQMSADDSFLKNNWSKIRRTIEYVIRQDRNGDGMEDTPIENTLDAVWDGEISWLVGLCIAAVKAGEQMAIEAGDKEFAVLCGDYVSRGRKNMEEKLFNGEYFIHRPDAVTGRQKLGSYNTCHIDQVYGQSWAHQVALGRILDKEKTVSALKSLWKYNFTPDVGPYIKEHLGGRPYALEGEGGMIMNTNPKNEAKPYGENVTWQMGYFHECMSGFEHQVAAHMMVEGMEEESLILTRMIHDRYHAAKRNPFNEIECSDHYARAMASYGTFITTCGFEYHGPKGYMKFAPKIGADHFKAPFTSAQGWGTYSQHISNGHFKAKLSLQYGNLRLLSFGFELNKKISKVLVIQGNKKIPVSFSQNDNEILLIASLLLKAGEEVNIQAY